MNGTAQRQKTVRLREQITRDTADSPSYTTKLHCRMHRRCTCQLCSMHIARRVDGEESNKKYRRNRRYDRRSQNRTAKKNRVSVPCITLIWCMAVSHAHLLLTCNIVRVPTSPTSGPVRLNPNKIHKNWLRWPRLRGNWSYNFHYSLHENQLHLFFSIRNDSQSHLNTGLNQIKHPNMDYLNSSDFFYFILKFSVRFIYYFIQKFDSTATD